MPTSIDFALAGPLRNISLLVCVLLFAGFTIAVLLTKRRLRAWRALPFSPDPSQAVFLSYKSEDAQNVRFIAEQLIADGQQVWFNEYRVPLRNWDADFELELRKGTRACGRAAFFTNAKWCSSSWCTDVEAGDILPRLPVQSCIEVRMPNASEPHTKVPQLRDLAHVDATGMDRWALLAEVSRKFNWNSPPTFKNAPPLRPLRGRINMIPYELNIAGWQTTGEGRTLGDNFVLPSLRRTEEGAFLSVNIIVGKRGREREEINAPDNRQVFVNLRGMAREYFEHMPLAAECVGVHLLFNSGLSHGAFTYWGRSAWCRKYSIILPARDGGMDLEFVFTCSAHGDFRQFCRHAWLFDDLAASLTYGIEW